MAGSIEDPGGLGPLICACGHENPGEAKFCLECGDSLAPRCSGCGTQVPHAAKFCLECGRPVPGGTPQPSRQEVRKVVTVVFCDLAGSTSLQEHMDPESVRRVMERFYATLRAEIEAAGGVVVKFTGDGVMAGFGIREAGEEDALCAVRASVAMQRSFAAFAEEIAESRGAQVSLRLGVNTGEVVVADQDDDVVGDVVNVAARLEHAAGEGTILVGEETWRLTRDAVTFEAVDPLELKGKAEPVPAYRVVSLEPPPQEDAVVGPFVGRADELERLLEIFEASVASASPEIVTVVGSPGLGKTRIASEFAAALGDRARVLEARCYAAGAATYAPIAEALREAAGIVDTAPETEVVASLEGLLAAGFAERERVAKLAASLLGVGQAAAPQETFWAVRRLLEGLAASQPIVLVVDDVQWAEPMLLDLLDHVVEWAKDAPIVVVALARPEIRDVRPSLLDAGSIVLEGLAPDDTAQLAAGLLGAHDLPPDLVRRILEATEGNPLFVRELLRMLVDDGVLSRNGDGWVVTVEAEEIDVPPTIHALLSARIERLRDEERAVVERASVVGKEFYRGAVLELVPPQVGSGIDTHLETLRRKELVEPEGTYWIDERVFRFHHVLIRDAAYRRLLKEARAELHERFADWLEAKVGDLVGEHDEVLGYHLEQAHTYHKELGTTGDHTAELGRRAAAHLASATHRALDRDDLTAAATLSARALALTDDDDARARLLLERCEALLGTGDVAAAPQAVAGLRRLAADERLAAWADCFDGQLAILTDPSRLRETATTVEDAARRLEGLGDVAGAAKAHAVHAQALAHLGQFGACEAALDRALAAAREAGDRRRANAVLAAAPVAALWGPNPVPRASGRCLDVVRVLRITAGAPAVEATALRCQAVLEAMRGRTEAAHRMLASARKTLEELGLRHALIECDLFSGLIDLFSGEPAGAEAALRAAHEGFAALNVGTDTALAAALLARVLVDQDCDDEALALTEESQRLGGDDLKTAIAWRTVRAQVLARRGEHDEALTLARAAVALAEPTDALVDHADARLALAEVLRAAGREEEAGAEERLGRELYARKEATGGDVADEPARDGSEPAGGPPDAVRSTVKSGGVRAAPGVDADLSSRIQFRRALLAGDERAMARLLAPDGVFIDRRSGLRSDLRGGRAYAEAMREMWQDIEADWEFEVLAQWSDDVALARTRVFGDGWENINLDVGVRRDGVRYRLEVFDEDDYTGAFDRLDELAYEHSVAKPVIDSYLAASADRDPHGLAGAVPLAASGEAALVRLGDSFAVVQTSNGEITDVESFDSDSELGARRRLQELAPSPSYVSWVVRHQFDRHAHQDWDALRSIIGPDVVVVDHRPVGWGTLRGIDRLLEFLEEGARTASMTPDGLWITEWIAITEHKALFRYRWAGTTADGVDFGFDRLMLTERRNGVAGRAEIFDPDQIDLARSIMAGRRADLGRTVAGYVEMFNARDWSRMAEFFAPDYVLIDHRAAGFAHRDVQHWVRGMEVMVELSPDVGVEVEPVFTSSTAEVALYRFRGQMLEGGEFALDMGGASRIVDGLGVAGLTCGLTDIDAAVRWATDHSIGLEKEDFEALRRGAADVHPVVAAVQRIVALGKGGDWTAVADRLGEVADRAVPSVHAPTDGRFAEFGRRWQEAFEAGAGRELAALYSPTFEVREHQHHVTLDLEAHLEEMRRAAAHRNAKARVDSIVCLGARHGVNRTTFSFDGVDESFAGASEVGGFSAVRVDDEGRCELFEWFPSDQLHRALARAEELYIEDEATGEALVGAQRRLVHWRMAEAHNEGDWEAFARSWAPDVTFVDRRRLGWGVTEGRDAVVELIRAIQTRSVRHVWSISEVHAISDDGCVYTLPTEGIDRDGGRYEQGGVAVAMLTDEGVSRVEVFPFDAVDTALERLEEIRDEAERARPATTLTEWFDRVRACLAAGDLRGYGALWTEDVVHEEKRPLLRSLATGRRAAMDALLHVKDLTAMRVEDELIATRGDRLEVRLVRCVGEDTEGGTFDVPILQLHVMNEEGLVERATLFEPEDLQAALEELDERYVAPLPDEEAEIVRAIARTATRYNAHDWDGYASAFHADVTVVDHRPAGWGTLQGVGDLVPLIRGLVDLVPDASVVCASIDGLTADAVLTTVRTTGTDTNGGPVEFTYYGLFAYRDGTFVRYELFPIEEREAALARMEELTSGSTRVGQASVSNAFTELYEAWADAIRRRDWDTVAALQAPDMTVEDRRAGLRLRLAGLDDVVESQRTAVDLGYDVRRLDVIATRGDRLALHGILWALGDDAEIEMLVVSEMDEQGRRSASIVFDADALEAAVAELDDRHDATLPDALRGVRQLGYAVTEAYNSHDWDRLVLHYAPDVTVVDHRRAGWGTLSGAENFKALVRGLADLVPDISLLVTSIDALTERGMASTVSITGTDRNGASVELAYVVVWTLREGRIEDYEVYPTERREAAIARLEELTAEASSQTTVERAWERMLSAQNERDMGAIGELLAPDYRLHDHIFHCELDRDGVIADLEFALSGPGVFRTGRTFVPGDRHGLFELLWSRGEGRSVGESEMSKWFVNRCDDDGRFHLTEWFAEPDVAEALARTEELYLEDEATGDEAAWSRGRLEKPWRSFAAYNAGALGSFASMPPEFVTIDHRPGGLGELRGRDAWLGWKRTMADVAVQSRFEIRSVRSERNVVLLDMAEVGTTEDGGPFEIPVLIVLPIGAARQEIFSPEQRDLAERRFRELVYSQRGDGA